MKHIFLIALALLFASPLFAQWQSVGNLSSYRETAANEITIQAQTTALKITILATDLIRVCFAPDGTFQPDMSWAVVKTDWPEVSTDINDNPDELRITTGELTLVIRKRPLRLTFLDKNGNLINRDHPAKGMAWSGKEVRVWKDMPQDEYYLGFGEKAGRLQKKFSHMTMWNSDIPAYNADTDPLYQTIPFFYGIKNGNAYGIFFDNSYWSSFDMGKESGNQYSFGAQGGDLNYYFFYGPSPSKVLSRYTELVGRMPLPPRWSLGYQQCRWSYPTEQRVKEIASGFRSRNIPCDVLYLDIDYMDGYRIFTWNKTNFPDPKRLTAGLAKDGFRVAVIVDPGIKYDSSYHAYRSGTASDVFLKYPNGKHFIGKVWPGECAFPDFSDAKARTWWGNNFKMLIDDGVRGWWNDMNEPSVFDVPTKTVDLEVLHNDNGLNTSHAKNHNIYGMQMTQATYEGVRQLLPNERPFVLTRASYAGGHRYSAAWTGDNVSSWEHLAMAVPMCLNLSVSGQPFVGSDIGGFIGYPSGELFARWLQLGVFTPLMRAHSVINEKNKEPWEFGDEFTAINRETINLRYQLLPYIYNVMQQASATGIPAMRPMLFAYPDDPNFIWSDSQFMFGNDLLIAPVLKQGETKRSLHLPEGSWYDYWSGVRYQGGRDITVEAPLDRIPVFVKAGAIIPSQQVVQYTGQAPIDPITFTVYPTELQSTRTYYEDDGISFEYQNGKYFRRMLNQWNSSQSTTLTISKAEGVYNPPPRKLVAKFVDVASSPKSIEANGRLITAIQPKDWESSKEGWVFDSAKKTVALKLIGTREEIQIRLLHP